MSPNNKTTTKRAGEKYRSLCNDFEYHKVTKKKYGISKKSVVSNEAINSSSLRPDRGTEQAK